MVTRKNIGGYRLVSLGFLDLALISTATACEGLAPALASKSKKRVVLTDIVVSGEPKNDVGVEVEKISGGYAIKNVYGYDLEIVTSGSTLKATPSADHITASEIDSETATAGQALLANGSGGVAFGDIGASNIKSGSATSGQVLTADGSGGVEFATPSAVNKRYAHYVYLKGASDTPVHAIIFTDNATAFDGDTLKTYLSENGHVSKATSLPAYGGCVEGVSGFSKLFCFETIGLSCESDQLREYHASITYDFAISGSAVNITKTINADEYNVPTFVSDKVIDLVA